MSTNTENPDETWVARVSGFPCWFVGPDEQTVIKKATTCWTQVQEQKAKPKKPAPERHWNAGKVWLYNTATGERVRAVNGAVQAYLAKGFIRQGPGKKQKPVPAP